MPKDHKIFPTATEVEATEAEISEINTDVFPQLDGPAKRTNDNIVFLEFNHIGDIVGPQVAPNLVNPILDTRISAFFFSVRPSRSGYPP